MRERERNQPFPLQLYLFCNWESLWTVFKKLYCTKINLAFNSTLSPTLEVFSFFQRWLFKSTCLYFSSAADGAEVNLDVEKKRSWRSSTRVAWVERDNDVSSFMMHGCFLKQRSGKVPSFANLVSSSSCLIGPLRPFTQTVFHRTDKKQSAMSCDIPLKVTHSTKQAFLWGYSKTFSKAACSDEFETNFKAFSQCEFYG